MSKMIDLPDGSALRANAIVAVRLGDARPKGPHETELKPRVMIDFVVGDRGNCVVFDCESVEQRDALAAKLRLHAA